MRQPFSLLFLLAFAENARRRERARGRRILAASARFEDNYLYQIGSRLGFHGGKQKNPPLARMLTRRQGEKREKKEREKISKRMQHPYVLLLFLPTTASHIPGKDLEWRVEVRSWEYIPLLDGSFTGDLRKDHGTITIYPVFFSELDQRSYFTLFYFTLDE